ncbi:MAG: hypothetical protein N2Z75_07315 [Meiothermus sp.]|nr:hypothetical protein [Meiothermus sp.]
MLRPRFVYVWVRLPEIPVPLFLFAPLVMLEFFLMMGIWAIRRTQGPDPQLAFALHALGALRGQTWELRKMPPLALRKMPPLALVELETKPKAHKPLYVKIGLW